MVYLLFTLWTFVKKKKLAEISFKSTMVGIPKRKHSTGISDLTDSISET